MCPNPNKNPNSDVRTQDLNSSLNPNSDVRKQDLNSSLAAVDELFHWLYYIMNFLLYKI